MAPEGTLHPEITAPRCKLCKLTCGAGRHDGGPLLREGAGLGACGAERMNWVHLAPSTALDQAQHRPHREEIGEFSPACTIEAISLGVDSLAPWRMRTEGRLTTPNCRPKIEGQALPDHFKSNVGAGNMLSGPPRRASALQRGAERTSAQGLRRFSERLFIGASRHQQCIDIDLYEARVGRNF